MLFLMEYTFFRFPGVIPWTFFFIFVIILFVVVDFVVVNGIIFFDISFGLGFIVLWFLLLFLMEYRERILEPLKAYFCHTFLGDFHSGEGFPLD